MIAKVTRLAGPMKIDRPWNMRPWRDIPPLQLLNYMGKKPDHFPTTAVKVAYDDQAIYTIFRVQDQYVRAVAERHQDSVCRDSCVEFFFTPGSDVSMGYFNIEMNCGGTILFHYNSGVKKEKVEVPFQDCDSIIRTHSLPHIVEPEIQEPVTWSVAYAVPVELLKRYCQVSTPKSGGLWRANFYKCADKTSHPHWLTWAPVDFPKPNFHLPQYFGALEFE